MTAPETSVASAADLLEQGRDAYRRGDAGSAAAAFGELLRLAPGHAEGRFYSGLLAYADGRLPDAAEHLEAALAGGWRRAVVPYYLGLIAEAQHRRADAARWYERALALDPRHQPSRIRTAAITVPSREAATPPEPAAIDLDTRPNGVYELLLNAPDPISRLPLSLMDELRLDARPRWTAFLGRLLDRAFVAAIAGYLVVQLIQLARHAIDRRTDPVAAGGRVTLVVLVVVLLAVGWQLLLIHTTRYRIAKGRLQIVSGILLRQTINLELYRVTDVRIQADLLQQVTRDAALVLNETIVLVGPAPAGEIDRIFERLLNLVFTLRANPHVRGIIS